MALAASLGVKLRCCRILLGQRPTASLYVYHQNEEQEKRWNCSVATSITGRFVPTALLPGYCPERLYP